MSAGTAADRMAELEATVRRQEAVIAALTTPVFYLAGFQPRELKIVDLLRRAPSGVLPLAVLKAALGYDERTHPKTISGLMSLVRGKLAARGVAFKTVCRAGFVIDNANQQRLQALAGQ